MKPPPTKKISVEAAADPRGSGPGMGPTVGAGDVLLFSRPPGVPSRQSCEVVPFTLAQGGRFLFVS